MYLYISVLSFSLFLSLSLFLSRYPCFYYYDASLRSVAFYRAIDGESLLFDRVWTLREGHKSLSSTRVSPLSSYIALICIPLLHLWWRERMRNFPYHVSNRKRTINLSVSAENALLKIKYIIKNVIKNILSDFLYV